MFKSIIYNSNGLTCSYTIDDDDFCEGFIEKENFHIYDCVIKTYENKKLNVAANAALYFNSFMKHSLYYPTSIKYIQHSKLYQKYKEDIDKYLLLL